MNILLVEDNRIDIDNFQLNCRKIQLIKKVDIAQTIDEVVNSLQNHTYDLIFWNMVLEDYQGAEILKTFPQCPSIIALTSHQSFAIEAYEFGFLDYILKPYTFERLLKGVNRYLSLRRTAETPKEKFVFFKIGRGFQRFQHDHIVYGESYGTFTKLHLTNKDIVLISSSLSSILDTLPIKSFKRIHRSYFINYNKLILIDNLRIKLEDSTILLPLSKNYREQFSDLLDKL